MCYFGEMKRAALVVTAAVLAHASSALAQGVDGAVTIDASAGVEGADGEPQGVSRTRTSLRAGIEGWLDAHPASMLGLSTHIEVEPRAAFGADLRFRQRLIEELVLDAGPLAIFAPRTLIGAFLGLAFRPRLSDVIELEAGARGGVFFAGSDLPEDRAVIGQATAVLGIRIGL
jgi:hypothetical protein